MDKLVLIPFIIASVLLLNNSTRKVFLWVYIPMLTMVPNYFDSKIVQGLPELYFWSAALIPVVIAWVFRGFENYRYHWMDFMIFSYVLVVFYTQWLNSDYKIAQKILFNTALTNLVPYILVRSIFRTKEDIKELVKTIALLGAIVAAFNCYEARMFVNVFDEYLRRIWPHSVTWDVGFIMSRAGFKRAMGPFSHPIIAGFFFTISLPLAIWTYYEKLFKNPRTGKAVVLLNALGLLASISRAPIMGGLMGLLIIYYGWSRHKGTILTISGIAISILLMAALPSFIEYISVTRATAETADQQNAAYRKEMLDGYGEVVAERPLTGWGRFSVPKVNGMGSIDNQYLGVALHSGLIAVGIYTLFLLWTLLQLYRMVKDKPFNHCRARLAWCIIGGWVSSIFIQGTVYLGGQMIQYLFILAALSQLLTTKSWEQESTQLYIKPLHPKPEFSFARIL
jgi:hypothetical protein